jgi:hypothetical protein
LRLLCDSVGESINTRLALAHKLVDTVFFDVSFRLEAFFFLYFNFDPEPLPVETILETLFVALHVSETQEQIFVGSTPRVVNPHWVVCSNWSVYERKPFFAVLIELPVARGNIVFVPPLQNGFLVGHEIDFWIYWIELTRHYCFLDTKVLKLSGNKSGKKIARPKFRDGRLK